MGTGVGCYVLYNILPPQYPFKQYLINFKIKYNIFK